MLRKFKVTLNGKEYIVEMEEIGGTPQPQPTAAPVAAAPAAQEAPAPAVPQTPQTPIEGGIEVVSPMPGNILSIAVNVGDSVAVNQPLLVLEAMKMENSIVAPSAGTIAAINVSKGENIDVGTVMIVIK